MVMVSLSTENKARVIQFYEIINKASYDLLDQILDQNIVWHGPLLPGGEVRGD